MKLGSKQVWKQEVLWPTQRYLQVEKKGETRGKSGRGKRWARGSRRDAGTVSRYGRAPPCYHQSQCAGPIAENLVRDARLC